MQKDPNDANGSNEPVCALLIAKVLDSKSWPGETFSDELCNRAAEPAGERTVGRINRLYLTLSVSLSF